jgi:PKD repeat protein
MKKAAIFLLILTIFLSTIVTAQALEQFPPITPIASFTANSTSGATILPVSFTDTSSNYPTSWSWSFQNITKGQEIIFSKLQNPTQTFGIGNWLIKLNASNAAGYTNTSSTHFVNVTGSGNFNLSFVSGWKPYPDDYIWSAPVDNLPVDPRSDTFIANSNSTAYIYVAGVLPLKVVNSSLTKQYLSSVSILSPSINFDNVPYPIPVNPVLEANEDAHLLVYEKDENALYEIFNLDQNENGTYKAGTGVRFNLTNSTGLPNYTLRLNSSVSADASGMAMLPGIVRYDEVLSGEIKHATRMSLNTTGLPWVWPARGGGVLSSADYPGMGQRFRLKSSFDTSGFGPNMTVILNSWKKYGVMVADNSGSISWIAMWAEYNDTAWATMPDINLSYNKDHIHLSDFEAVNATVLMADGIDSGKALLTVRIITPVTNFTATPLTGASPLLIQFKDTSDNTPSYWDWYWFANETKSSDTQNATASLVTGTYNVRLYSSNAAGGDWENKTGYIISGCTTVMSFNKNRVIVKIPYFYDRCSDPLRTGCIVW